jgi:hypothetical protein
MRMLNEHKTLDLFAKNKSEATKARADKYGEEAFRLREELKKLGWKKKRRRGRYK